MLEFTEKELLKLQRIENAGYRSILQVPTYTENSSLRGEIGVTTSRARDIKIILLLVRNKGNILTQDLFKAIWIWNIKMDKSHKEIHRLDQ